MRATISQRVEGYVLDIELDADELDLLVENHGMSRIDLDEPWQDLATLDSRPNTALVRASISVGPRSAGQTG